MAVVGDVSIAQLLMEERTDRKVISSPSLLSGKNLLTSSANRMTMFGLSAAATASSHHELHSRATTARVRGPIIRTLLQCTYSSAIITSLLLGT